MREILPTREKARTYQAPKFTPHLVADQLRDGYWLEAPDVDRNTRPDLIGYGLSLGEVYWYQNPDWTRHLIADKVKMPIGMDFGDVTGNGYPDMVLCYDLYGPGGTIHDPNPEGARSIGWRIRAIRAILSADEINTTLGAQLTCIVCALVTSRNGSGSK